MKTKLNFDQVVSRKNTKAIQLELLKVRFGSEDVIPMWVADMNLPTSVEIQEALSKRVEHPIYGYTLLNDEFYSSIFSWLENRHSWKPKNKSVIFSSSVLPSISIALRTLTEQGDKVMIQTPVYPPFYGLIKDSGRIVSENRLIEKGLTYEIDFQDMEDQFKSGVKHMLFCSPQNPVGRVWSLDELKKVAHLCEKYQVQVFSDEIHADLILSGNKHIPLASVSDYMRDNTLTFMAPTKTFNLAGLTVSFAVIENREKRKIFSDYLNSMHLNMANTMGAEALIAAYNKSEYWLEAALKYIEGNIEFAKKYISQNIPQIKVFNSEGTYLLWLDFRSLGLNDEELKKFLVHKAKVALNPGIDFGQGGSGFARMNLANSRTIVEKALYQIKQALLETKE